jgi:hypothetical protein
MLDEYGDGHLIAIIQDIILAFGSLFYHGMWNFSKNVRIFGFYLMNDINTKHYNYTPKEERVARCGGAHL